MYSYSILEPKAAKRR